MGGETGHRPAAFGDAPFAVERAERAEQRLRVLPGGPRRRREPGETVERRRAPCGGGKHDGGEIGVHDLGLHGVLKLAVLRFGPKPQAHARRNASGASAPLVGPVAREAQRLETAHAGAWREPANAHQAGVYHRCHAVDRERGLGD